MTMPEAIEKAGLEGRIREHRNPWVLRIRVTHFVKEKMNGEPLKPWRPSPASITSDAWTVVGDPS